MFFFSYFLWFSFNSFSYYYISSFSCLYSFLNVSSIFFSSLLLFVSYFPAPLSSSLITAPLFLSYCKLNHFTPSMSLSFYSSPLTLSKISPFLGVSGVWRVVQSANYRAHNLSSLPVSPPTTKIVNPYNKRPFKHTFTRKNQSYHY